MVYDSGADTANEFRQVTTASVATDTFVAGDTFYVQSDVLSALAGKVWRCKTGASTELTNTGWYTNGTGAYFTSQTVQFFEEWNGNGWGDNNQFEITDNQSTLTDDNGNSALYGSSSFDTQYFIVED
jgi:hypothetical protein